jgi:putative ABC transport system permease protein
VSVLVLIVREAAHRKLSSALMLLAVVCAVALPVAFLTAGEASQRETGRVMRDLGYNLRIIPATTDMSAFWRDGYSGGTMPEAATERFAERGDLSYNHLLALLQRRILWEGTEVLLTGMASEVAPVGKAKASMTFAVEPATLHAGFEATRALGLASGSEVDLLGRSFRVAACLPETGTLDDTRVYVSLRDAQELLALPGRVNEIQALECGCDDPAVDTLALLRRELEQIVPEGRVLRMEKIAEARERQRRVTAGHFALVLPWVIIACAVWIACLTALNVRQRQTEIGILRALGHGSTHIAGLFVGKALALGALGALLGFALGTGLALGLGPAAFPITGGAIAADPRLLVQAILAAPLFAALASAGPALAAVAMDPAACLGNREGA